MEVERWLRITVLVAEDLPITVRLTSVLRVDKALVVPIRSLHSQIVNITNYSYPEKHGFLLFCLEIQTLILSYGKFSVFVYCYTFISIGI